ncbi:DNA-methyltransferase [Halobaculum gomorrense]|uniref:Type II methyltransferase n=1 Tax=Halobaculum gomorrense TaxID=43928 RepID=A0A1M5P1U6_9EURY|nr:site-specific DNA-methyltransferase [Halobaculum gomorrense]SHG95752.1 site-specific DNA-methyltransferase (cytosine-N4-specific) [Halobaculum gomorrense]
MSGDDEPSAGADRGVDTTGVGPTFTTEHAVGVGDARALALPDESVDLVVTSPPYPMVEQWDDLFAALDPAVDDALAAAESTDERGSESAGSATGDGRAAAADRAFDAMHEALAPAWREVARVLAPGGVACINVGDATRSAGGRFRLWDNATRVAGGLAGAGLDRLPGILWRKPTNAPTKFMGSGTLPPNAYVTLEHEHVLVFRKGDGRSFDAGDPARYASAYFWEERNRWFSDTWDDLRGVDQSLGADATAAARDRSGAFPFELPYRLICMYSTYGDRVLDPFWGTGTTTLAAMAAGRDSVGVERDPGLVASFEADARRAPDLSRERGRRRLREHRAFVAERDDAPAYDATHYDFPVVTKAERDIRVYEAAGVESTTGGYRVRHEPIDAVDP